MAKIITDTEMLEILRRDIEHEEIDDYDQYIELLTDIGQVIAKHHGGVSKEGCYLEDGQYAVAFEIDENVPEDGGVYADYDKDVTWKDGEEH